MSLPPGFLDELRTRLSLVDVVGRKVMWDTRKSNQGKGDMWAPCPFHQEKTASFHVDDRKGFYYCFGCHAKGDAISFVRETENVGFMEAVEILAGEAGMPMPARDPQAQQKADRLTRLAEAMERAARHFRMQLASAGAAQARAYLEGRGLGPAACERFGIGYAPDARQGLFHALTAAGVPAEEVIDAGLAARPENGGAPYDRFRNRIVFPIRDGRGRCIGFGGRAMDPAARAKYLNSPETPLFDKGRSLYNHGPAREAAGTGRPLVVAEGYMDVIALVEGGFEAAVAPLGTAVTEEQLRMIWRIHPEPVIALDGDKAGLRAAYSLIDRALPMLEPGRALRFCLLPGGKDPDDLIRSDGPEAMTRAIEGARSMVELLWQRETEGRPLDSPERRAALDAALRGAVARIPDGDLRSHYKDALWRMRRALYAPPPSAPPRRRASGFGESAAPWGAARSAPWAARAVPAPPTERTRLSLIAGAGEAVADRLREAVILAVLIRHPALLAEQGHLLEEIAFEGPGHGAIAAALLACDPALPAEAAEAALAERLGADALETLFASVHVQLAPPVRRPGDLPAARLCLAEELAKLAARRGARAEIAEAMDEIARAGDERAGPEDEDAGAGEREGAAAGGSLTWRLGQAAASRALLGRLEEGEKMDFDIAENGARIAREERSAFDTLLRSIDFERAPGRKGGHNG